MRKWIMTGTVCLMAVLWGNVWECRAETVEQQVVLEGVESEVGVPEEILVDSGGSREYVPVKSARVLREYWTEDFEFPVLFYVYDAEYYELGEYRIPRQEDGTVLSGYEDGLLEKLGLNRDDYVIEKVTWDGDAYMNEAGIQCRDAVARGRKRVRDYEVVYAGEMEAAAETPGIYPDETQVMVDAPDQVKRVTDTGFFGDARNTDLRTVLKKVTVVTVVAVVLLLLLLVLILLCMRFVKWYRDRKKEIREKKWKNIFDYCGK